MTTGTLTMALKQRWDATWGVFGVAPQPTTTYDQLIAAYSESGRYYHSVRHLEECFSQFDAAKQLARVPAEIEIAIWFHDAVYDTHKNDNEELSAVWAVNVLRSSGLSLALTGRIEELILATKHQTRPYTMDGLLFLDVDLSILGASAERFNEYERQIRDEYAWVPENEFRQGRAKLLREISAREQIYFTEFFQTRLETAARENIKRSLAQIAN